MSARAVDLEVLAALRAAPAPAPPARGDWQGLRAHAAATMGAALRNLPAHRDVVRSQIQLTAPDGSPVAAQWFEKQWHEKQGSAPGSAVVHAHPGGMVAGSLDLCAPLVIEYVARTGVPFLSVDYRLAPEVRGDVPVRDVFAAFAWLVEHAGEQGVDPGRIALMGESAGGGLAAGAAILAREHGLVPAKQILVYPMLDDRNTAPPEDPPPLQVWSYDANDTGWRALLGDDLGAARVPPVVAPARLTDFAGLAPAYLEVGDLDIFRDETIAYAAGLARAGTTVELHVHPGAPHGYELVAPQAAVSRRAMADRERVVAAL